MRLCVLDLSPALYSVCKTLLKGVNTLSIHILCVVWRIHKSPSYDATNRKLSWNYCAANIYLDMGVREGIKTGLCMMTSQISQAITKYYNLLLNFHIRGTRKSKP